MNLTLTKVTVHLRIFLSYCISGRQMKHPYWQFHFRPTGSRVGH